MDDDARLKRAAEALRNLAISYPEQDYSVALLNLSNELEWRRLELAYEQRQTSL